MELLDHYQRLEIALKLKRGKLRKAKSGGFVGGQIALGYKHVIVDNKPDIAIDQKTAKTISMIRTLRKRGLSMNSIANQLNENQVPTKRGGKWYASTIHYILNNKLYKGLFEYNTIKIKRLDLAMQWFYTNCAKILYGTKLKKDDIHSISISLENFSPQPQLERA